MLFVPDHFKTMETYNEIMRTMPEASHYIPDQFKAKEICEKAVRESLFSLQYFPDWFVAQSEQIKTGDDYYYDDDEFIEWYEGYQKGMAQKAQTKEELLPIAQHPDRVMDWCMSEDEKKETEKLRK